MPIETSASEATYYLNYLRRIAEALEKLVAAQEDIATTLKLFLPKPDSIVPEHGEPTKEKVMSKPASLAMSKPKAKAAAATVPSGDKDTVTITVLDQQGNPYTGPLTFAVVPTSSDTTTLTTDAPVGPTYGEHFLKSGSVTVTIVATFSDGSTLSVTDSITITGVPGSLVATHSIPTT